MREEEGAEAEHEEVRRPLQEHVAKQRQDQADGDPAAVRTGGCTAQPEQQRQDGHRLAPEAQPVQFQRAAGDEGQHAGQCNDQGSHGCSRKVVVAGLCKAGRYARQAADANGAVIWRYLTLTWQSKDSAGATSVSQGRW
ncbi:hypothetical protein D3C78_1524060 [compost metagenome]